MPHYPALKEFIDERAPGIAGLTVTFTQGAPPNLFMQDASGSTIEEVAVSNWKVEHIEEYLAEKLVA